jgi:hypothetical protein
MQKQSNMSHNRDVAVLLSACLYLSSKINEEEGRVRIRDFLNVAFFVVKEDEHVRTVARIAKEELKKEAETIEISDGIWIRKENDQIHVSNHYSKN